MTAEFTISPDDLKLIAALPEGAAVQARAAWLNKARPKQLMPLGNWDTAIWLAGRFYGKSKLLYEEGWWQGFMTPNLRVHCLAPTIGDVRRTVFEGESGLLACCPKEIVADYNRGYHELTLRNGSKYYGFSMTEEADRLRGPQCHLMLVDEAAAADRPAGNLEAAYKTAALGCRLPHPDGKTPARKLIVTTPRPIPYLKRLLLRKNTAVIRGTSYENLANVSTSVQNELLSLEGTVYGRQEIHGEMLDEEQYGIFKRPWFRLWPAGKKLPDFVFIMASLDPAVSERDYDKKKQERDPSAGGVFGVFNVAQCFTEAERKRMNVRSKYAALACDIWEEYLGFPELLEKMRGVYRTKYGTPGRRPDVVVIEGEKTGISLRQALMQYGVPTWPFNSHRQSKTMRAHMVAPLIMQGMLFVPESLKADRVGMPRDWAEPLISQMCTFAGEGSTEHDDLIDMTTQAMISLSERGLFHAEPVGRTYPDPDEKDELDRKQAAEIAQRQKNGKGSWYGA